jgi:hypothetical protein
LAEVVPTPTSPKSRPVGEIRNGEAAIPLPLKLKLND